MVKYGYPFDNNSGPFIVYLSDIDFFKRRYDFNLTISEMENDYTLGFEEWKIITSNIKLSKREKQCLYLYYWKGLTQKEIAFIIKGNKILRQTVSKYIKRAINKIAIYYDININDIDRNKILGKRGVKNAK